MRKSNSLRQIKPTVLVVDDAPGNILVLARGLAKDYEVLIARSGKEALTLLTQEQKPDLILLDVMMPEMDGYEVCRQIKDNDTTKDIPVIFLTAKEAIWDQQLGFNLGAVDYITKPVQMPLVLARVAVQIRLKLKSDRLEQLAMLDGLTDVANRRALDKTLLQECERAARDRISLAVIMIDIDHFKAFNDHYGHGVGDECLRQVAQAAAGSLRRPGDFFARYGGEEFCVILPNCDNKGALTVAENIQTAIADLAIPHACSSVSEHVTISIGIAARTVSYEEDPHLTIQREADEALYTAKLQGRNRAVVSCREQLLMGFEEID